MWQRRRHTQEHTWRVPETPIRSRQPRLTRAADDVRIVADIRDHPSTNEVATTERPHWRSRLGQFRRRFHGIGIHHRVPAVKERLEDQHRVGRLQFPGQELISRMKKVSTLPTRAVFTAGDLITPVTTGSIFIKKPRECKHVELHQPQQCGRVGGDNNRFTTEQ
ncbi:hypothetical protein Hamer_G013928 [Homarus americanus]|uniref:Uncharacterized protein n=1 Tax=Homarus americanus TaxID=6706 RepID=A0A8J5KF85_HOMAM|nr:hypothetical protein Hamer_G013928 [Homarus americanus]